MGQMNNKVESCSESDEQEIGVIEGGGSVDSWNKRGDALSESGDRQGAIRCYHEAILCNGNHAPSYNNMGIEYKELGMYREAIACYKKALQIDSGLFQACYGMGVALQLLNEHDLAISAYETTLTIKPDLYIVYAALGDVYLNQGKVEQGIGCYKEYLKYSDDCLSVRESLAGAYVRIGDKPAAIEVYESIVRSGNEGALIAKYRISALRGENLKEIDPSSIKSLFDKASGSFEERLVGKLQYIAPSLLRSLYDCVTAGSTEVIDKAVDIGCGTGLSGLEFRGVAKELIGVDVSPQMLEKAEEKNIYDDLVVDDVCDGLRRIEGEIDLAIAADVLIYIGDLNHLFEAVSEKISAHSLFVFSTEHMKEGDYSLEETGRYRHSYRYVREMADKYGFDVKKFSIENIRKEKGEPVEGGLYVLGKVENN